MPVFVPSPLWVVPFTLLLAALAILPLAAAHAWESNGRKLALSALLGAPVIALYLTANPDAVWHAAEEYGSFVVLLGALFYVAGGVLLEGDIEPTPKTNTGFLAAGALLASLIGTTGASMLLIRPLLTTNQERRFIVHTVVFFIFVVSNVGGLLLPIGDPPLFIGYLRGVPFLWTLRLTPMWIVSIGVLLLIYYVWDTRLYAREPPERLRFDHTRVTPLQIAGAHNLLFLVAIVVATATLEAPWREATLLALVAVSWWSTPRHIHVANRFSLHPIGEVAAVFAGIFATMLPALDLLRAYGADLAVTRPWQYLWATGLLSAVLDNTPTYVSFFTLAQSQQMGNEVAGVPHLVLEAISVGAVVMGAMTYIGNGPNFMVRAIAEERGVRMPSFGGFLVYSGTVVLPVFALLTALFFR